MERFCIFNDIKGWGQGEPILEMSLLYVCSFMPFRSNRSGLSMENTQVLVGKCAKVPPRSFLLFFAFCAAKQMNFPSLGEAEKGVKEADKTTITLHVVK